MTTPTAMSFADMERLRLLRDEIAENDRKILGLVRQRVKLVERLWGLKARNGLPQKDEERERALHAYLGRMNRATDPSTLSPDAVDRLVDFLLDLTEEELEWPGP